MSTLLLVLLAVGFASGVPVYHRVQIHSGTTTATEDVMIDTEANYVMITVGDVNTGPSETFVNMHDMESGYSAYKNISGGNCMIEPLKHTMDEMTTRVDDIKQGRKVPEVQQITWNCGHEAMTYQMLYDRAGARIAGFCKDYTSYSVTRYFKQARYVRSSRSAWCFLCFFWCS